MGGGVVVFDIETQNKISDMPGAERLDQICNLQVSCLSFLVVDAERLLDPDDAAQAVEDGVMTTLWRDEDPDGRGPFEPLFRAFDDAELIVSYNGLDFDHPVLWKHSDKRRAEAHLLKAHDAFSRLRANTQMWYKLDNLLRANGLATKTANGLEAIRMWNEGERERLREYCESDTRQLARLLALPELRLPGGGATRVPNYLFGMASALAARRMSDSLRRKRARDATDDDASAATGMATAS